jgi:predicted Zn-dependent peptidase
VDEIVRRIDGVTSKDVARAAQRIFGGRPTVAAMGPLGRLDSYDRLVARLA